MTPLVCANITPQPSSASTLLCQICLHQALIRLIYLPLPSGRKLDQICLHQALLFQIHLYQVSIIPMMALKKRSDSRQPSSARKLVHQICLRQFLLYRALKSSMLRTTMSLKHKSDPTSILAMSTLQSGMLCKTSAIPLVSAHARMSTY